MSWKEIIQQEKQKDYFKSLIAFIQEDAKTHQIYPNHEDIFNAFKYCSLDDIKVCILGMDPYINEGQAHGLSFSVLPGITIPPSLRNIFKELETDFYTKPPTSGCLIPWARQGVLLLNSVLTVRQGQSGSHKGIGWETFTDRIINTINELDRPVVYLLWGSWARGKKELLNNPKHLILEAAHPSPLSAYNGFFGCKHFSKTNRFLIKNILTPIDWKL